MNINEVKIGTKLELELINSLGDRIGQAYISQLLDIIDKDQIVIAAPIHEARLMLVTSGTRIRLVFLHNKYGLLSFTAVVTKRENREHIISLHARIEGAFDKIQRRKYYRLECVLDASYRIHNPDTENPETPQPEYKKALSRNLSGSGVCLVIDEEVPKGTLVEVRICLGNGIFVQAICKVMRSLLIENIKLKKYELGMYFTKISPKDQEMVIKYIFDRQRHYLRKGTGIKD